MPDATKMNSTLISAECTRDHGASQPLAPRLAKLSALHPTPLVPSRQPKRRHIEAISALRQIEDVRVSRNTQRTDRKVYYVDMYYRERQSRIPVHRHFRPSDSATHRACGNEKNKREPSTTIQVAYDDFLQVRHEAYELARASHLFDACAFCHHIIHLTTSSTLTPRWNSHWSKSDDEMGSLLTSYLTELLKVVPTAPCSEADAPCQGQKHIPRLFQSFLRSHGEMEA